MRVGENAMPPINNIMQQILPRKPARPRLTTKEAWLETLRRFRDGEAKRIFSDEDAEVVSKYMVLLEDYLAGRLELSTRFSPEMTPEECTTQVIREYDAGIWRDTNRGHKTSTSQG